MVYFGKQFSALFSGIDSEYPDTQSLQLLPSPSQPFPILSHQSPPPHVNNYFLKFINLFDILEIKPTSIKGEAIVTYRK